MTALELLNKIHPEHDRLSCSDDDCANGFFTRNGESWHGRCIRCLCIEIIEGEQRDGRPIPEFDPDELRFT